MVYTIRASTEPTAGEAGSGHGPHCPTGGPRAAPVAGLHLSCGTPRQARPGVGRRGGRTWSDGLQQEGHGCREAENDDQVEHMQQQPCLLCQGALG